MGSSWDYYEYAGEDDADECDHDDADFDTLEGTLRCSCGYSRSLSAAEIDNELRRMSEYHDLTEREERRQRWAHIWRRLAAPLKWFFTPKPIPAETDDEIPF